MQSASTLRNSVDVLVRLIEDAAHDRHEHVPSRIRHQAVEVRALLEHSRSVEERMRGYGYTPTEQRVACAILRGENNKTIGLSCGIKEHTVKEHLRVIYDKTGAESRLQLALLLLGVI